MMYEPLLSLVHQDTNVWMCCDLFSTAQPIHMWVMQLMLCGTLVKVVVEMPFMYRQESEAYGHILGLLCVGLLFLPHRRARNRG